MKYYWTELKINTKFNYSRPHRCQRKLPWRHFEWLLNLTGPSGCGTFVQHCGKCCCYRARSPIGRPAGHWGAKREKGKKHCKCMLPFTFRQWQRALVMSNVSNVHVISWSVLCLCRVCYLATITPRWVLAGSLMLRIIWSYRLLQQHDICYALGIDKLKCYNILI